MKYLAFAAGVIVTIVALFLLRAAEPRAVSAAEPASIAVAMPSQIKVGNVIRIYCAGNTRDAVGRVTKIEGVWVTVEDGFIADGKFVSDRPSGLPSNSDLTYNLDSAVGVRLVTE